MNEKGVWLITGAGHSTSPSTGYAGGSRCRCREIALFGIRTMLVEPGFFRTELLSDEATTTWHRAPIIATHGSGYHATAERA